MHLVRLEVQGNLVAVEGTLTSHPECAHVDVFCMYMYMYMYLYMYVFLNANYSRNK